MRARFSVEELGEAIEPHQLAIVHQPNRHP
jgi:hypothetical protein